MRLRSSSTCQQIVSNLDPESGFASCSHAVRGMSTSLLVATGLAGRQRCALSIRSRCRHRFARGGWQATACTVRQDSTKSTHASKDQCLVQAHGSNGPKIEAVGDCPMTGTLSSPALQRPAHPLCKVTDTPLPWDASTCGGCTVCDGVTDKRRLGALHRLDQLHNPGPEASAYRGVTAAQRSPRQCMEGHPSWSADPAAAGARRTRERPAQERLQGWRAERMWDKQRARQPAQHCRPAQDQQPVSLSCR